MAYRPLYQIAQEIKNDWSKQKGGVNYAAEPYLDAMFALENMTDRYGADNAKSMVLYFLSNAATWKGEVAKRVKKELNAMCQGKALKEAKEIKIKKLISLLEATAGIKIGLKEEEPTKKKVGNTYITDLGDVISFMYVHYYDPKYASKTSSLLGPRYAAADSIKNKQGVVQIIGGRTSAGIIDILKIKKDFVKNYLPYLSPIRFPRDDEFSKKTGRQPGFNGGDDVRIRKIQKRNFDKMVLNLLAK